MQEVCLIIPCYNEEKRLDKTGILDFLGRYPNTALCFVNDGSKDNTKGVLKDLQMGNPKNIFVLDKVNNEGKAEAVRSGIHLMAAEKRFSILGFWDADLSTPLSELPGMLERLVAQKECVAVFGSRLKRLGSTIERNPMRHIFGRVFSTLSNWILGIPIYDSQCGAKIFRGEAISAIFGEKFVTRWLFDVEILCRMRNQYGARRTQEIVLEHPLLKWTDVEGSKLKLTDYFRVPFDLMRIYFHYN